MAYLGHFPAGHPDHPHRAPTIIIVPKESNKPKENHLKPEKIEDAQIRKNMNPLKTFRSG